MDVIFEGIVCSVFICICLDFVTFAVPFWRTYASPRGYIVAAISPLGGGCIYYKRMYQVIY